MQKERKKIVFKLPLKSLCAYIKCGFSCEKNHNCLQFCPNGNFCGYINENECQFLHKNSRATLPSNIIEISKSNICYGLYEGQVESDHTNCKKIHMLKYDCYKKICKRIRCDTRVCNKFHYHINYRLEIINNRPLCIYGPLCRNIYTTCNYMHFIYECNNDHNNNRKKNRYSCICNYIKIVESNNTNQNVLGKRNPYNGPTSEPKYRKIKGMNDPIDYSPNFDDDTYNRKIQTPHIFRESTDQMVSAKNLPINQTYHQQNNTSRARGYDMYEQRHPTPRDRFGDDMYEQDPPIPRNRYGDMYERDIWNRFRYRYQNHTLALRAQRFNLMYDQNNHPPRIHHDEEEINRKKYHDNCILKQTDPNVEPQVLEPQTETQVEVQVVEPQVELQVVEPQTDAQVVEPQVVVQVVEPQVELQVVEPQVELQVELQVEAQTEARVVEAQTEPQTEARVVEAQVEPQVAEAQVEPQTEALPIINENMDNNHKIDDVIMLLHNAPIDNRIKCELISFYLDKIHFGENKE